MQGNVEKDIKHVAEKLQGFGCSVKTPQRLPLFSMLLIWKVKLYLSPDNTFWKEIAASTGLGEGGKSHGSGPCHKFILLLSMDEMQKKVRQRKSTPCIIKGLRVCQQKHYPQATNNTFIWGDFKTISPSQCFPPLPSLATSKSEKDNCSWTEEENCLCTLKPTHPPHTHTHTHTQIKTHFDIKKQSFKCSFDFGPYWDRNLWHGVLKEHIFWKLKDLGLISGLATTTVIVWVSISSPEKWK